MTDLGVFVAGRSAGGVFVVVRDHDPVVRLFALLVLVSKSHKFELRAILALGLENARHELALLALADPDPAAILQSHSLPPFQNEFKELAAGLDTGLWLASATVRMIANSVQR
jgi:hypothetical protein